MEKNYKKNREDHESASYEDFANVEISRKYTVPEIFPEGPYGSPVNRKPGKNTPWDEEQRSYSAYNYEFKEFHHNIPRNFPGSHPVHSESKKDDD